MNENFDELVKAAQAFDFPITIDTTRANLDDTYQKYLLNLNELLRIQFDYDHEIEKITRHIIVLASNFYQKTNFGFNRPADFLVNVKKDLDTLVNAMTEFKFQAYNGGVTLENHDTIVQAADNIKNMANQLSEKLNEGKKWMDTLCNYTLCIGGMLGMLGLVLFIVGVAVCPPLVIPACVLLCTNFITLIAGFGKMFYQDMTQPVMFQQVNNFADQCIAAHKLPEPSYTVLDTICRFFNIKNSCNRQIENSERDLTIESAHR